MIFINFKTYKESSGENALSLINIIQEVSKQTTVTLIPVVQALDAEIIAKTTSLDVWIQHVDAISHGAHTGWSLPENAIKKGVKGTFLNHSEHKIVDFSLLSETVSICKSIGLKTLIFAADIAELQDVITLKPDYISYEPPELVGSTESSVSKEKPEVIQEAADIAKEADIPLIVGAGIKSSEDIRVGMKLGATGFAVASDVVKAEDPKKELEELIVGFNNQS